MVIQDGVQHVEMVVAKAKHGKATYNCILNLEFAKKRKKDYTTRHMMHKRQQDTKHTLSKILSFIRCTCHT
jgi:hypothetical protein